MVKKPSDRVRRDPTTADTVHLGKRAVKSSTSGSGGRKGRGRISGKARPMTVDSTAVVANLKQIWSGFLDESVAASQQFQTFLKDVETEIESNLATAIRLNEQTHWDTLEIQGGRVIMEGLALADNLSAEARVQIRASFIAVVQMLAGLALAAA